MERVITEDCENPVDTLVHSLKAHGTGRKFGVVEWRCAISAPFHTRHPDGVAEVVRLKTVEGHSVKVVVEVGRRFGGPEVQKDHELVGCSVADDANVLDDGLAGSDELEQVVTVYVGGHGQETDCPDVGFKETGAVAEGEVAISNSINHSSL